MTRDIRTFTMPDADIQLYSDFFSEADSDQLMVELLRGVDWQEGHIRLFGKLLPIPRLQAWHGDEHSHYSYSGVDLQPVCWNETLNTIRGKIFEKTQLQFNSALLNLYRNGQDSMGWHADDEKELGTNPVIASVSFGEPRKLLFRHKKTRQREDILLNHGSLLIMSGTTQHYWQHAINKSKKLMQPRINITFRNIK